MRVVYDVSLLGLGYHGFKSGLFRVAENIARTESKQCDLTFCSTLSLNTWINSLKYLEANPILLVHHLLTKKLLKVVVLTLQFDL